MPLSDKIVVITGASSGIGFEIAKEFSRMGSAVIVTSRKGRKALTASRLLSNKCTGIKLDITNKKSISDFTERILKGQGRVDILVNNAGYSFRRKLWFKKFHTVTEKELIEIIKVDLLGSFRMSKEVIKLMLLKGNGGVIINIVSTPSISGFCLGSPYSIAKAGMINMTKHIAFEYAQNGIRAYSLALGNIASDATFRSLTSAERIKARQESAMKRWGRPEEVAKIATTIANNSFSYATGNTIIVDGGSATN